tara:strand:- start:19964 stop:21040 length:1077 start_codon:yes stop_codon:yes gene_type:complete
MQDVFIIAEAGVNHNGSKKLAIRLIEEAVVSGADAVKFQTFKADELVTKAAEKAEYQKALTDENESQYQMLKRLELSNSDFIELASFCASKGIEFISTPFDLSSLRFLIDEVKVKRLKVSSGDLTNSPMLIEFGRSGLEIILSTGMANVSEIEDALWSLAYGSLYPNQPQSYAEIAEAGNSIEGRAYLQSKVTLLHCTTEYPSPPEEVNIAAMELLRDIFGIPIGYSDHTKGALASLLAVSRGAVCIEKHFTLDRSMDGPDHAASLEPSELAEMVETIRQIPVLIGRRVKWPTASERKNLPIARKSLVASQDIALGDVLGHNNIAIRRPGGGLRPIEVWRILGEKSSQKYAVGEYILE